MEKVQKPQDEKDGKWVDEDLGWALYNFACQKTHENNNKRLGITPNWFNNYVYYDDCKTKFIWHTHKSSFKWRQSFDYFLDDLFSKHVKLSTTSLLLMILGFLMLFGIVDRGLKWIILGKVEK
jgi:hypothetical protein